MNVSIKKFRTPLIALLILFYISPALGQNRNIFPVWTFHQKNINIHGISVGVGTLWNKIRNTNTNGIKLELIGFGILTPMIPQMPMVKNDIELTERIKDKCSEKINGLSLSLTGTWCDCVTNGISIGTVGQYNMVINGLSISGYMNFTQITNGLQIAFYNGSYELNGLQLGIYSQNTRTHGLQLGLINVTKELKGFQIGLWNVNSKRKLPLINWNFESDEINDLEKD